MEEEIPKIIEKLGQISCSAGKFVQFNSPTHKPVEFSSKNFKKIDAKPENSRIAFIDGGNNPILDSASFSLQFLRTYCTIYSENKREKTSKTEFFLLASSSGTGNSIAFDVEVFGAGLKFSQFSSNDETLSQGSHRIRASAVAMACRKIAELNHAEKIVGELNSGDIIVLDRDLESSITGEKAALDVLFEKAESKGIIICGISKTTRLFTDEGSSAVSAVASIAPEGSWLYMPVAEINDENHRAELCFVKLHPASKYIFRLEICNKQKESIGKVVSLLAANSTDPVFLGYPYGMIDADRFARVSNEEAEYMKVKIVSKAGKQSSKILDSLKSVDAHSILDNIS